MSDLSETMIRVGGYAPRDSVHSRAIDHFAEFVDYETNGEIQVDLLYNVMDGGGKATDLFDKVRAGDLTWCYYSSSYLGDTVPALNALEIPFLFDSLDDAHAALDGEFGATLGREVLDKAGFEVLGFWDNGFRHLTNAVRPIVRPDDCAGLSIRLQPNHIHEALTRAWGMHPVTAELSAGIAMITSGEVDAQENPLGNTFAYGVPHQFITLSAHLYGARGLFANPDEMAALGPELADIVRRGARSAIEFQRVAALDYERELQQRFEAEGRHVFTPTDQQRDAFRNAAQGVIDTARSEVDPDLLQMLN